MHHKMGYTLLSPITSLKTSRLLFEIPTSYQLTINTGCPILPTPRPSVHYNELFNLPSPSEWWLKSEKDCRLVCVFHFTNTTTPPSDISPDMNDRDNDLDSADPEGVSNSESEDADDV
jgi:hypothetical protein